jgi:hypothetical protein
MNFLTRKSIGEREFYPSFFAKSLARKFV